MIWFAEIMTENPQLSQGLVDLNTKYNLMKNVINLYNIDKNKFICKNERNEIILQRLQMVKKQHEQLKELLYKDLVKISINGGKRKILLKYKVEEFQERDQKIKLQYQSLPLVAQLQELIDTNESLNNMLFELNDLLDKTLNEYINVYKTMQQKLNSKIIEFSKIM